MPHPKKLTTGWLESWEKLLAENLPFKVFLKGPDLTYLACNENYAADHGLKPSEILGRSDYDLYPRELAEMYRTEDLRILETGHSETIEGRFLKDGQEHYGQTTKSLFRDSAGQVIGILGTFWDITELVQVKEALQESEARYRSLVETAIEGVTSTDLEGNLTFVNDALCRIMGYSQDELLHKPFAGFLHPDDLPVLMETYLNAVAGAKTGATVEYRVIQKNGQSIWFSTQPTAIVINGKAIGFNAILHDITERKRAEETLQESEQKFHSLYMHMIEGAALHQLTYNDQGVPEDYVIIETNPAFETQLGISRDTVIGKTSRETYGVTEPPYLEIYARVALTGESKVFETYFPPMAKHFSISAYCPYKGFFATIFEDITERKRVEEALQESEEKYRRLIENSHDIIYTLTPDGVFSFVSPGWTALLGHPVDQVVGRPYQQFIHPDDLERCQTFLLRTIQTGQRQMGLEYRVQHTDGSWRWHITNAVPLKDAAGTVVGGEGVASDITERKRLEGEMEKTRADFLFGVSHELKTPLFLMNISLEMLENASELGRVKRTAEFMETWKRNLHRLQHLVFNMVDSQRTQTMGFKVEQQSTDFRVLIERVVQEQALLAEPKKVRITMDLVPIPPLFIDPDAIHRLVENLLTNAIKFSPRSGEVTIRLVEEDAQAVLTVKDQGPGISAEEQEGLFLPFQRAATAVRSVIPGTGLGLYVAKIIVEAHGGTISLRSKVGQGTTVTVQLPLGVPEDKKQKGT